MTLAATVIVPTFDHGPTLLYSVGSALAQTVDNIEVVVVGDGVPDVTRELVAELARADERVRFFDNAKGPRHGEFHRHRALAEARGRIVCYLSDDDLFLPGHVEAMTVALEEADFAHALPIRVEPDGTLGAWLVDLEQPFYRRLLLDGENRIPLSCGAHTLELYRRLPHGWRTTPQGIATDLYMWQQILEDSAVRASSTGSPSILHFPSSARACWPRERRLEELSLWAHRLEQEPERFERALAADACRAVARAVVEVETAFRFAHAAASQRAEDGARVAAPARGAAAAGAQDPLDAQLAEARELVENLVLQVEGLKGELALLRGSRTFRYSAGLRRLSAGLRRRRVPGGLRAGADASSSP